jgi:Icc protein
VKRPRPGRAAVSDSARSAGRGMGLPARGFAALVEHKPYFIQRSDTHLFADPGARLWNVAPDPRLDAVVERMREVAPDPEFVLITGDCSADGSPASYERLHAKIARLSSRAYYLPGNHDDAPFMARLLADRKLAQFEKFTQTFDACGWRFILLDSSVAGEDGGSIGNEQREWLRAQLARDGQMPMVIAVHHNPLPVGSTWLDTMTISDAPALLAILDTSPNVKLVLFGHVHQEFEERRGQTVYASAPSTFFQFKPHAQAFGSDGGRADGARVVMIGGEPLAGRVVRVATEDRRDR